MASTIRAADDKLVLSPDRAFSTVVVVSFATTSPRGIARSDRRPRAICVAAQRWLDYHFDGLRILTQSSVLNPRDAHGSSLTHGDVLTAISDGMVALLKEFYGRGPTRTKSYFEDDLVVCVLRGGFSRVEETLLEGGRGPAVIQQRMAFQELMRERFEAVIEQATGRHVIGFMSGNQQHPDMMCEVFILAPTDLVDEHELRATGTRLPR
jgi:uncharacterized protein YbcI